MVVFVGFQEAISVLDFLCVALYDSFPLQGTGKAKDSTKSTAGEASKLRKRKLLPGHVDREALPKKKYISHLQMRNIYIDT